MESPLSPHLTYRWYPRSRGVYDAHIRPCRRRPRIIPARAGFTQAQHDDRRHGADHPRSRGVYQEVIAALDPGYGSSPLARGLPRLHAWPGYLPRIIPARAGFTKLSVPCARSRSDHPRSRGVYLETSKTTDLSIGSSPLARGLRRRFQDGGGHSGIIPARAGFTFASARLCSTSRDHPRSRGVYNASRLPNRNDGGSSPLARGLRVFVSSRRVLCGIIPARAGFTAKRMSNTTSCTDHPRSRGVYPSPEERLDIGSGSSPLARGLHPPVCRQPTYQRIIPARAGFTYTLS